ncbi:transposase, partial [Klebsiella pneumoniae]|nr:transposase [Klebsiella pneumoniae]
YLRRNWGGEYENVAILVAIAVNEDGFREVLGAAEGMKEDKASWVSFFQWLRGRGLDGVKLIVGDKCMGMLEAVGTVVDMELCGHHPPEAEAILNSALEKIDRIAFAKVQT